MGSQGYVLILTSTERIKAVNSSLPGIYTIFGSFCLSLSKSEKCQMQDSDKITRD